jgi:apolipoprotein D and lipocalin family protein
MGTWYVAAGRFTIFEKDVNNAVEKYSYDDRKKIINIDFSYRQKSPEGKEKKIPQTAKVVEGTQNAHWLISPLWPFKFDYLVVALAEDYSWVAIGVPDQKYLWIMFRKKNPNQDEIQVVISKLNEIQYDTKNLIYVPQKW